MTVFKVRSYVYNTIVRALTRTQNDYTRARAFIYIYNNICARRSDVSASLFRVRNEILQGNLRHCLSPPSAGPQFPKGRGKRSRRARKGQTLKLLSFHFPGRPVLYNCCVCADGTGVNKMRELVNLTTHTRALPPGRSRPDIRLMSFSPAPFLVFSFSLLYAA